MIPPVQTIPVWGRARSGAVQQESQTGLDYRLAVLDWTGLVWTSPRKLLLINSSELNKSRNRTRVLGLYMTSTSIFSFAAFT